MVMVSGRKTGVPGDNPWVNGKNMLTPHRKVERQNLSDSGCSSHINPDLRPMYRH